MSTVNMCFLFGGVMLALLGIMGGHLLFRYNKHRNAFIKNPYELFLMAGIATAAIELMILAAFTQQTEIHALTKMTILSTVIGTYVLLAFGLCTTLYGGYIAYRSKRD